MQEGKISFYEDFLLEYLLMPSAEEIFLKQLREIRLVVSNY